MSRVDGDAAAGAEFVYAYRSSLLGAGRSFRLAPDGIAWDAGRRTGFIPYRDIRRVRMSFSPMTTQTQRFITELWAADGLSLDIVSTSWKSLVELERLDASYSAFVTELHRRIARSQATVRFDAGGNPVKYWIGVVLFVVVAFALAALIVRSLQQQAWGGAVFIAVFLLAFLWQAGSYFRRNKPGSYRPDALPADLMPPLPAG